MNLDFITQLTGFQVFGIIILFYIITQTPWMVSLIKKRAGIKNVVLPKSYTEDQMTIEVRNEILIYEILHHETLSEQSVLVNRVSEKVKRILLEAFRRETDFNNRESYRELRAYDNILDISVYKAKKVLIEWIEKNHLLEKNEGEFKEYAEETAGEFLELINSNVDEDYFDEDFTISRKVLRDINKRDVKHKIIETVEDSLYAMRKITSLKTDKVVELKDNRR